LPKSEKRFSAHWLASLTLEERQAAIAEMSPEELEEFQRSFYYWARDEQWPPPGDWRVWLYLAGRGAGKTRSGAEWVQMQG
jgi:phage terminase large subunit-like protein